MALSDLRCRQTPPTPNFRSSRTAAVSSFGYPTGGRWWRLAFRFKGKQKLLAPGVYPAVSLADARQARAMPSSGRPCSRAPARLGGS
jgi:hypothetical protein